MNMNWHFFVKAFLSIPDTVVPCEPLFNSDSCIVNKTDQLLFTCLCVCVVGYPTTIERENAYSISRF